MGLNNYFIFIDSFIDFLYFIYSKNSLYFDYQLFYDIEKLLIQLLILS